MKSLAKTMVVMTLALLIAAPVLAGDKEKKKDAAKGKKRPGAAAGILKKLEAVGLSEEQESKIKEVAASFSSKIADAHKKAAFTADQRAAMKKAREDGKKGKEIFASIGLSDEQKAAQEESQKLNREMITAIAAVLNPEQKAKAKLGGGGKKKGAKPGAKKKPAGDKKKPAGDKKKPAAKADAK